MSASFHCSHSKCPHPSYQMPYDHWHTVNNHQFFTRQGFFHLAYAIRRTIKGFCYDYQRRSIQSTSTDRCNYSLSCSLKRSLSLSLMCSRLMAQCQYIGIYHNSYKQHCSITFCWLPLDVSIYKKPPNHLCNSNGILSLKHMLGYFAIFGAYDMWRW